MKRAVACGLHAVDALLQSRPESVIRIRVSAAGGRVESLAERARSLGISVEPASAATLDGLSAGAPHQGVAAEYRPAKPIDESALDKILDQAGKQPLVLVLDQVQDPHNLGACLRSAAAAGACAVMIPRNRAAALTPAASKAAAGAAESLPLVQVTNLARAIAQLQQRGLWCVGLAGEAAKPIYDVDLCGPLALIAGGEQDGLRRLTRERCDQLASIPMDPSVESLNVSVASGVALFEARRQRAAGSPDRSR